MASEGRSNDLGQWLRDNKLGSLRKAFHEADIEELEDLLALETEEEVTDFVTEVAEVAGLKTIKRKKLQKAVLAFIAANSSKGEGKPPCPSPGAVTPSKPRGALTPGKKTTRVSEEKTPDVYEPVRQIFPPGINLVPYQKREYRLPKLKKHQYAFQGGNGFMDTAVKIWTTVSSTVKNMGRSSTAPAHSSVEQRKPERLFADPNHKIILVCGKTGAGKSTLINSMMNYIYGVRQSDNFRLKLIQEQKKKGGDADSCTDHISSYRIARPRGGNINYDLTIIDTPGFGDVRGLEKDMQILEEFKYVFDKILTNINGICFVVKSADNRLDASQTYVFNNILNLWAKDVADNIFILMTFADGKRANCIDALNKNDVLKNCKRRLKINNSAFTDDPLDKEFDDMDDFTTLFWKMGMTCFEKFFRSLEEVVPKSIEQSKQVLRKRDNILTKIHHISKNLDSQLVKQQQVANRRRIIESKRAEIDAGKEVVWYEKKLDWIKQPSSNSLITTCIDHDRSCHPTCCVSDKKDCCMMNEVGHCEACGCHYSRHINASYQYVRSTKQIRKSNWDNDRSLRNKHDRAKNAMSESERMLRQLEQDLKKIATDVEHKLAMIQKLRNELELIALRPQLTTVGDYIDQLIENENESPERDPEKIQMLKKLKQQESIIAELQKKGTITTEDFLGRDN